ncbi:sialoadhesin-like isoform X3 [Dicentrarchus labrax]|uniref:sialoadhesin-like isoform X3 n=1 Tax=Dicentrarchus labrax TaxID=13489 RepID=UPI0021F50F67|nr:sialoadhesin-like isoform X3 [Dicentrarchus labrax]
MFLAEAGCVLVGFILYISGVQGQTNSICALKGSSVNLPCSAEHPTSSMKWYTVHWNGSVQNELSADGNRVMYKPEESHPTLTINDLRESDANFYCCRDNTDRPQHCWVYKIQLRVTDLQVKVIPATEGQTVTLMCSTSCPLTETPAAYIWYKNGEFLYQDWSPWYQQLVSSEEAVRYSCAIKGYEDLRAPEVSVDSVTSTCFTVTYAKGRMCSYKQTSEDEPCSITYPREVQVQKTPEWTYVKLTCRTSCPLTVSQTAYRWYRDGYLYRYIDSQQLSVSHSSVQSFSCAVKGLEDLHSAEVCLKVKFTPSAVVTEGQTVTLTCSTSCPLTDNTNYIWYLNSRPLTLPENQNKHLVLDPVSSQHAGNYSCAVKTHNNISSREKTLTVHSKTGKWTSAAAAGVGAVLLVIIPLTVFCWIRRKRTSDQSPTTGATDNMEQLNPGPLYVNISAPPAEQEELHYSRVHFSKTQTDPLYSTVQPRQPKEQEDVAYAAVIFRSNKTTDSGFT